MSSLKDRKGYWSAIRTLPYVLVATLPMLIIYEIGVLLLNANEPVKAINGADAFFEKIFGIIDPLLLTLVIIFGMIVGLAVALKKKETQLKKVFFGFLLLESAILSLFLAPLISFPLLPSSLPDFSSIPSSIVHSFGAGFYEELLFRVILLGGMLLVLRKFLRVSFVPAAISALVLSSLLFSGAHHIGLSNEPFMLGAFIVRSIAGMVLGLIYLLRGFAVAAWSHALYDVWIMTNMVN